LFEEQFEEYRDEVLPPSVTKRVAVEAECHRVGIDMLVLQALSLDLIDLVRPHPAKWLFESWDLMLRMFVSKARSLL
jgi:transketolase